MSLSTLADALRAEVPTGTVTLSRAALEAAGLTAPDDLDALMAGALGWAAGTPLALTAPLTVGTATDTALTVSGTLSAHSVSGIATVEVTAAGAAVTLTASLPLGAWTFTHSFPALVGFPFDELVLDDPTFLLASVDGLEVAYGTDTIPLTAGLNLAGGAVLPTAFAAIAALLAGGSGPLVVHGPIDPTVITDQLAQPNVFLSAPLADGPLPALGPVQLDGAAFFIEATTEKTRTGLAQYTDVGLATTIDLGSGEPQLECRVSVGAGGWLDLLVQRDPTDPHQPTLAALVTLMGGRSLYDVVPAPIQSVFSVIALKGISASIGTAGGTPSLVAIGLSIGTTRSWTVADGFEIGEIDLGWQVDLGPDGAMVTAQLTGECAFSDAWQFMHDTFPGVFSVTVTSDLAISATYQGDATLSTLLAGGTSSAAVTAGSFDFDLEMVRVDFDVPRSAFALVAEASASIPLFGGDLAVRDVMLSFAKAPDDLTARLSALVVIGDVPVFLRAGYANGAWHFAGGLAPGGQLDLGALVGQLCKGLDLPTSFVPDHLVLDPLRLTLDIPATGDPSWSVDAGVQWIFSAGALQDMEIDAAVDLVHDGAVGTYHGTLSGEAKLPLPFGTVDVVLTYAFAPGNTTLEVEWKGFASATYSFDHDTIVFALEARSLGDMLAEIVRLVEDDPDFQLPAPWDLLDQISLKDFSVTWRLKPAPGESALSLTYDMTGNEIDLGFVSIRSVTLSEVGGKVQVGLDLKLFTDSGYHEQTWPAQNPTPPPGQGTKTLELDLLALGQHVTVAGLDQVTEIDQAITLLESFAPPDGTTIPVLPDPTPGQPVYAPGSSWLVGTRFKLLVDTSVTPSVALLDMEAVFNDPQLYGLKITLGGPKAGIFGGLSFEVMYRKVSDTVGVYQIELTLPDWARHIELGEVSITLPIVGVDIYTNGDFRIDFGFPANMDFSRSFAVQAFPFTGAGGFYFGRLSAATATGLPQTTAGAFGPVTVFGIGLQIGLGKSIDEGIFSAQLSVSVFGIVEGVVAPWHPTVPAVPGAFDDEYYYWVQGTVGIVGKIVGKIDFAIISAEVNITVQLSVQMTIEAHRAIPVHVEAGVSVAITLSINLGLFSIHIHLSFSLTVTADFAIGSDSQAPWDPPGLAPSSSRQSARLLAAARLEPLCARRFQPLAVESPIPLTVHVAPHLTLGDWTTGAPTAAYVVGLFVAGPIGQTAGSPPSDFEVLGRELLLWTLTEFGDGDAATLGRTEALAAAVTAEQVAAALAHLTAGGPTALAYADIRTFLSTHFTLTLATGTDLDGAVALPMLPDLVLGVPAWGGQQAETVDFSTAGTCTPAYLEALQELLAELAVDLETPLQKEAGAPGSTRPGVVPTQSLATFVCEDVFALMARHLLQAAADSFGRYPWRLAGTESLDAIVAAFDPANGLTAAAVGVANADLPLTPGTPLVATGVRHQIAAGESWDGIAAGYAGVTALALAEANATVEGLLVAGVTITVDGHQHPIGGRDTFASIAAVLGVPVADVVVAVGPLTDVLAPLALLAVPSFTRTTVAGDRLGTVAAALGVSVAGLAADNAAVGSLFASTTANPAVAVVPGLTTLTADQVVDVLTGANAYANLAGITTRFLLNGLRLPVTPDITVPPDGPQAGAADAGLQALIGQQVALPSLAASDRYELTLSAGEQGGWISFPSGSSLALPIDDQAAPGGQGQIDWINAVLTAAGEALRPDVTSIASLEDTRGVARRFVLPAAIPVQSAATSGTPPTIFPLPDALLSVLAQPTTARPAFSLLLGTPARAGAGLVLTPAQQSRWASLVTVTVTRPPAGAATAMGPGTYALVGTDATGTVLLERLLQSGQTPSEIHLAYPPSAAAPASAGLQIDDPATVSTFIVQANLATATAPQGAIRADLLVEDAAPEVVVSDPLTFVRLLWECSIVASGGFSLYYEAAPGTPGLPEHLFDVDGRATLQLLVVHAEGDEVSAAANAAVVGDAIDRSRTSVVAQSEANPVTLAAGTGASLATLAAGLHLTISGLATQLADQPLLGGATLQVAGGVYETRAGDALDALATRFATTGEAIEALNAGLGISWDAIPAWTVLRLPATTAITPADPAATLATVATRFGIPVAALGLLNATTPLLTGDLAVVDQIVDATAVLPPGIGGFTVVRQQLATQEGLAVDPTSPAGYLDSTFHLLGYQLAARPGFRGGPAGLPVGPGDPLDEAALQEPGGPAPAPATPDASTWRYEHLLPLAGNAIEGGLAPVPAPAPPASADPYAGVGTVAQVTLEWRDVYGNRARTPLTDPTLDPTGPQNRPPIPVEYTDTPIGVAQWPSTSVAYGVTAGTGGGPPTIDLQLRFDPSRYAGADAPGVARNAAQADRQTLARVFYQLNQVHPDGTPHVTITATSSLDDGTPHPLTAADDAAVRGLVLEAWRYLDGLLGGTVAAGTEPIVVTVPVPVAATSAASIFELTVALTLARDPALVAAASRDETGVVDATTIVSPLLADPSTTDVGSLAAFAAAFEAAYADGDVVLRIAVGDSREGAADSDRARLLWAVRTATTLTDGALGAQITGPPTFWAPPPLSVVPVSREAVPIWPFVPDGPGPPLDPGAPELHSFTNVDLDVWAAQALAAIDAFLTPGSDVPAFVLDANGGTTHLDDLRAAKTALAAAIAATVTPVLSTPSGPDQAAIDDAQSTWQQRLLVTLSSAYTVDVAVQLPVAVSSATDPGWAPPALYGHPVVTTPSTADEGTPPPSVDTLSTFKVTTGTDDGHLTFLFTADDPGDQASVVLDLGFQVDQVEHQIGPIAGIDGYQASSWLTFPRPLPPVSSGPEAPSTIEVPILLRAYPDAPRLTSQSLAQDLDPTSATTLLRTAMQWTYVAEYAEQHVAQDVTQVTTTFNVAPLGLRALAEPAEDLFSPLARLIAALPALQAVFAADLPLLTPAHRPGDPTFDQAARAVAAFTTLVGDVAASWAPISPPAGTEGGAPTSGTPVTFTIAETRYPPPSASDPDGGDDLLVTVALAPGSSLPAGVPLPVVAFAGWEPVTTGSGVRYQDPRSPDPRSPVFLSWEAARALPGRTVETGPLAVLGLENAQMGLQLVRNAELIASNPTMPAFVYRTPLVTFTSPFTPLLAVGATIDVAAITTGAPVARPLVDQLQTLFAGFFATAPGTVASIQLQVAYAHELSSDLPVAALAPIVVPIALVPSATFAIPGDWSPGAACAVPPTADAPFVCRLAQVIRDWVAANEPTRHGQLVFDLAAFSDLSASTLPLVRLSALTLDRSTITDL